MKINKYVFTICLGSLLLSSCTDLEEEVLDGTKLEEAATNYAKNSEDATTLLNSAYESMRTPYQDQARLMALDLMPTDAMVGPTRGGDWDDAGVWRQLHTHTFGPTHGFNKDTYNDMYNAVNSANLVIGSSTATPQQVAEARFLRALHYYHIIDLWGSAAYREIGSDTNADALVYPRNEATDWVISELEDIMTTLPNSPDPTKANKNAAHWLLAKFYLNYGVFAGDAAAPTFDAANMDKVIANVDAITGVSLAADYWDNFIPRNSETSTELIFVNQNFGGESSGPVRSRWFMGQHYSQKPSGWNGFTTLAEYYAKFDPSDERIYKEFPNTIKENGYVVGFQEGQQYSEEYSKPFDQLDKDTQKSLGERIWFSDPVNKTGPVQLPDGRFELADRLGNKLKFTKEIQLITGGSTLESAGIRGVKYVPDNAGGDNADNDFVVARYADALLMKAEALARKGDVPGAQAIVNTLADETTTTVGSVDDLLLVRARVLWWEGWRRNDIIRFGTFLKERELKPYVSDPKYLLYPIPLAGTTNPNMSQNPGY